MRHLYSKHGQPCICKLWNFFGGIYSVRDSGDLTNCFSQSQNSILICFGIFFSDEALYRGPSWLGLGEAYRGVPGQQRQICTSVADRLWKIQRPKCEQWWLCPRLARKQHLLWSRGRGNQNGDRTQKMVNMEDKGQRATDQSRVGGGGILHGSGKWRQR